MGKAATMIALTFGVVLLLAGTAFAVTKMCQGDCRGTGGDDRLWAARGRTRSTPKTGTIGS